MTLQDILKQNSFQVSEIFDAFNELREERQALVDDLNTTVETLEAAREAVDENTDEEGENPDYIIADLNTADSNHGVALKLKEDWDDENGDAFNDLEQAVFNLEKYDISADVVLMSEDTMKTYAQDMADDVIDTSRWPATCIDWDRAVTEFASDYSMVELDGDDYYVKE